jgi:hypothetical protein
MSDPRVTRAISLGNELLAILHRLDEGVSGADAALFLDRRARCNAFLPDELEQAGVSNIVSLANEVWNSERECLAQAAADALDLEGLRGRARDLGVVGTDEGVIDVAIDALLVGALAEELPKPIRQLAVAVCEEIVATFSAWPELFEDVDEVALDRARHERPSRMPLLARELIGAMRASPRLASYDAEHEHEAPPEQAVEQMEAVLSTITVDPGKSR